MFVSPNCAHYTSNDRPFVSGNDLDEWMDDKSPLFLFPSLLKRLRSTSHSICWRSFGRLIVALSSDVWTVISLSLEKSDLLNVCSTEPTYESTISEMTASAYCRSPPTVATQIRYMFGKPLHCCNGSVRGKMSFRALALPLSLTDRAFYKSRQRGSTTS
jgi:hypothetical protein